MKCLVLGLGGGAVAWSVFTVAVPLINWLARPVRRDRIYILYIYTGASSEMCRCASGRNSIPGGISGSTSP